MAVVTDTPVELYEPVELTDDESATFLEAFERTGSIRGSARETGIDRHGAYLRRYRDPEFRSAWDAVRAGRLHSTSDDLFAAVDEMVKLTGDWEAAIDELVNVSFDETETPPRRDTIDAVRLAVAREQLHRAGREWAGAVVQVTAVQSFAEKLGVPIGGLDAELDRLSNGDLS